MKRLKYQREGRVRAAATALGYGATGGPGGLTGSSGKLLSARERAAGAGAQAAANALALQNSPEWLRPLLMLLPPVPKFVRGTAKPPPHLTEMALSTTRQSPPCITISRWDRQWNSLQETWEGRWRFF